MAIRADYALIIAMVLSTLLTSCTSQIAEIQQEPVKEFALPELNEVAVNATVVNVIDGVTIEVDIEGQIHTVSYLGAALPEIDHTENGSTIYRQALEFNRFLVEGKSVQLLEGPADTNLIGNLIRYVYVSGELANETLITKGYATVADFPDSFDMQTSFLLAEENARSNLRGVWNDTKFSNQESPKFPVDSEDTPKFGGTLPKLPSIPTNTQECDFSGTSDPVIKAIIDPSGDKKYYLPNDNQYSSIVINESSGDVLFCTEFDAMIAGFSKSG